MLEEFTVAECLAALILIGAAAAVLIKAMKPFKDIIGRLDSHDDMLARDLKRLDANEQMQKAMAKALLQMTNHMIDGNHVDKLKEARDNLQDVLIET